MTSSSEPRSAQPDPFGTDPITALAAHRIVPVVAIDDAGDVNSLGEGLLHGGLPLAEVTLRTAAAADAIRALSSRGDILVGAGTVLTAAQVDEAVRAGARFIVSPGLSRAVVERCREHGVAVLPGAVTATEIQAALELGLTTVKFFPAEASGGLRAIRALSAPFATVRFVPTGGVTPANLSGYLDCPAVLAVGGSWMVPRASLASRDWLHIAELVRAAVRAARPDTPEPDPLTPTQLLPTEVPR
jgi:2-dehydro-3-deoxyphosphogluconate aldolase/(4S)-4-hydroxy-2-oxoglutarate aldolase